MHLRSDSFFPWSHLDPRLAFGTYDEASNVRTSDNRNPHLAWSGAPEGTRSFALLCYDTEAPTDPTHVNREGTSVPLDLPRANFFHWVLADLPPEVTEIPEGSHAAGVVPGGKDPGPTPSGGLQGINDYTSWFAGDEAMAGAYGGYDGPCPPWNDERVHAYHFEVYALDVESLGLTGAFTGPDLRAALEGHVLARASLSGLYAIYPGARR